MDKHTELLLNFVFCEHCGGFFRGTWEHGPKCPNNLVPFKEVEDEQTVHSKEQQFQQHPLCSGETGFIPRSSKIGENTHEDHSSTL